MMQIVNFYEFLTFRFSVEGLAAAQWSGVLPSLSAMFTEALLFNNTSIAAQLLSWAATCSDVVSSA